MKNYFLSVTGYISALEKRILMQRLWRLKGCEGSIYSVVFGECSLLKHEVIITTSSERSSMFR